MIVLKVTEIILVEILSQEVRLTRISIPDDQRISHYGTNKCEISLNVMHLNRLPRNEACLLLNNRTVTFPTTHKKSNILNISLHSYLYVAFDAYFGLFWGCVRISFPLNFLQISYIFIILRIDWLLLK